jgi:hypothetical protein
VGLSFEVALRTLQRLREKEPEFTNSVSLGRWCWDSKKRSLKLVEFDLESAITSLKSGEPVIPVWCDQIHDKLGTILTSTKNLDNIMFMQHFRSREKE